jgi:hypothetical protein
MAPPGQARRLPRPWRPGPACDARCRRATFRTTVERRSDDLCCLAKPGGHNGPEQPSVIALQKIEPRALYARPVVATTTPRRKTPPKHSVQLGIFCNRLRGTDGTPRVWRRAEAGGVWMAASDALHATGAASAGPMVSAVTAPPAMTSAPASLSAVWVISAPSCGSVGRKYTPGRGELLLTSKSSFCSSSYPDYLPDSPAHRSSRALGPPARWLCCTCATTGRFHT